jgi:hypothetical protein
MIACQRANCRLQYIFWSEYQTSTPYQFRNSTQADISLDEQPATAQRSDQVTYRAKDVE